MALGDDRVSARLKNDDCYLTLSIDVMPQVVILIIDPEECHINRPGAVGAKT